MNKYIFACVIGYLAILTLSSCTKKQTVAPEESAIVGDGSTGHNQGKLKDSDSGEAYGLETVHFEYDSSEFTQSAKATLKRNAQTLKHNQNLHVQVEGHCDERGGIQYNIALGEKRAKAVQRFLSGQGIPQSRVAIISYGKERPISMGNSDSDHAKNRRGNFVITEE